MLQLVAATLVGYLTARATTIKCKTHFQKCVKNEDCCDFDCVSGKCLDSKRKPLLEAFWIQPTPTTSLVRLTNASSVVVAEGLDVDEWWSWDGFSLAYHTETGVSYLGANGELGAEPYQVHITNDNVIFNHDMKKHLALIDEKAVAWVADTNPCPFLFSVHTEELGNGIIQAPLSAPNGIDVYEGHRFVSIKDGLFLTKGSTVLGVAKAPAPTGSGFKVSATLSATDTLSVDELEMIPLVDNKLDATRTYIMIFINQITKYVSFYKFDPTANTKVRVHLLSRSVDDGKWTTTSLLSSPNYSTVVDKWSGNTTINGVIGDNYNVQAPNSALLYVGRDKVTLSTIPLTFQRTEFAKLTQLFERKFVPLAFRNKMLRLYKSSDADFSWDTMSDPYVYEDRDIYFTLHKIVDGKMVALTEKDYNGAVTCTNGGTVSSGKCACPTGYAGDDCSVVLATPNCGAVDAPRNLTDNVCGVVSNIDVNDAPTGTPIPFTDMHIALNGLNMDVVDNKVVLKSTAPTAVFTFANGALSTVVNGVTHYVTPMMDNLYNGEFMPYLTLSKVPEFSKWIFAADLEDNNFLFNTSFTSYLSGTPEGFVMTQNPNGSVAVTSPPA